MKQLPDVTLVCIDCKEYGLAIQAIKRSLLQIEPAKTLFFTDIKAFNPNFPFEIVKINSITSKEMYSHFVVKELWKHISTKYVLIIQADGWVLDGDAWSDDFLEYDYVGAPWLYVDGRNMGNGGFSLRSKKLMSILGSDDFIEITHPEDEITGRLYRKYLEEHYDIRFASDEVGDRFSFELREPICHTLGFHGKFHEPYKPTVVIKREGALGDCVALEPLLEYFHNKGNKVFVDIPIEIAMIYAKHFYNIGHISQLDSRIPTTVIDLDGTYENNPKQLHLKSYFEAAGVTDYTLRNPKLLFHIGDHNRLFNKYVVFHAGRRDQEHRNVNGLDWDALTWIFMEKGYQLISVGQTENEYIHSALHMNTAGVNMLMYLMAGASYFIGVDSGPAAIAVALGIPSVIFSGSVDLRYIHPDMSNILWLHNHDKDVCQTKWCWHDVISNTGQDCVVDVDVPPCSLFDTDEVVTKIEEFVNVREFIDEAIADLKPDIE